MKHLKTFENFDMDSKVEEAFLGGFRPQAVIKEILSDIDGKKKELTNKYNDYVASLGDRKDVAAKSAPSVSNFINGKIKSSEVKPEEVAKVVMKAKVVKKNDKGEWEDVGAYGGADSGTGAEGAYKG